jgi:hypothetical protein
LTVVQAVCQPFDAAIAGETELRLSVPQLLGDLECGEADGQVARLSVSVEVVGEEPRTVDVACDAGEEIVIADLPGKASIKAFVTAFGSANVSEPLAGAACQGVTFQSASVTATCGTLSREGTLRVDLQAALQVAGLSCNESSVSDVQVLPQGDTKARSFPPPDCLQPFDATFAGSTGYVTVTALDGDKNELGSVACHGQLVPGARVLADCEPISAP